MAKATTAVGICAALLWANTVWAAPTGQQRCDVARAKAWKNYVSCQRKIATKKTGPTVRNVNNQWRKFAQCRHTYFNKWTGFQSKQNLAGSTCIGARFTDNGDGTVSDKLTGLQWEQKTHDASIHDVNNAYSWSTAPLHAEDGTAFTVFLAALNGAGFAGVNDWRLPTSAQLQSALADFKCRGTLPSSGCQCPSQPCVDPALGPTRASAYWSASPRVFGAYRWVVSFEDGSVGSARQDSVLPYVRAVRGGF